MVDATVMPLASDSGATARQPGRRVVVAGDDHHRAAPGRQVEQRPVDDALGLGGGRRGVEQVAGHDHEVDVVALGDAGDLGEDGPVLGGPGPPADRLADVPVGRVEHPHRATIRHGHPVGKPANGSSARTGEPFTAGAAAVEPPFVDAPCRRRRRRRAERPHQGGPGLARPGGPRRERELDHEGHRQLGLRHEHGAGLDDGGPLALHRRQEAVLAPARLGRVEPAHDPDGRVGHDAPLDLAGGLLGADEHDAERPAALGHVEQDLLDGARPVARCVLVELVEHDELQRAGLARALLALERLPQHDADHEPLGPVVEVVQVDDRDLGPVEVDPVGLGPGDVGPDEVAQVAPAPCRRRRKALTVPAPMARPPHWSGPSRSTLCFDELDEVVEACARPGRRW